MASPFQGCWLLYGTHNLDAMVDALCLPHQFKNAMKNIRTCEEIRVNGDHVHLNIHVPTYSVTAHSKDINFQFGVEGMQSLPFGKSGKATVTKESDNKWVAKIACAEGCDGTITREIRNGEMWVTIDVKGIKTVRKFERCYETCPQTGARMDCPTQHASPFQGGWRLYGSDNFDKFMEALGVPAHWRGIFSNLRVCENIHINGNDVHVRISLPDVVVPGHIHEMDFKFNEQHELTLPFGHHATALPQKISENKWVSKLTGSATLGDGTLTRELVNGEMWITLEARGQRIIRKFERCVQPCGGSAMCK